MLNKTKKINIIFLIIFIFSYINVSALVGTSTLYTSSGTDVTADGYLYNGPQADLYSARFSTLATIEPVFDSFILTALQNSPVYPPIYLYRSFLGFDFSTISTRYITSASVTLYRHTTYSSFSNDNYSIVLAPYYGSDVPMASSSWANFMIGGIQGELTDLIPINDMSASSSITLTFTTQGLALLNSRASSNYYRVALTNTGDTRSISPAPSFVNQAFFYSAENGGAVAPSMTVTWSDTPPVSTSTPVYSSSTCAFSTSFSLSDCTSYLFYPSSTDISNIINSIKTDILKKAPWGYFNRMYDIWHTTATGTLPIISISIPFGNGEYGTAKADMGDMIIGGSNLINNIRSPKNDVTARDVLEPIVALLIAIAVIYTIIIDITGSHKHNKNI